MTSDPPVEKTGYRIVPHSVRVGEVNATVFEIGFTQKPMRNDDLVREVTERLLTLRGQGLGGRLALLNGAASLPLCAAIVHQIGHLFGAVAVWDPKIEAYVVAIVHGPEFTVGQTIPGADVVVGS